MATVSVRLRFVAPPVEDLTTLQVYEGPTALGPFTLIDSVSPIGTFPDYIDFYTTENAFSDTDWFAINWLDSLGADTGMSRAFQGGTTTLVARVTERVLQRDPTLDDAIVVQEAEAVICQWMGTSDPYDTSLTATYRQLNGLTYLVMVRAMVTRALKQAIAGGNVQSATIGLVTMRSGTTSGVQAAQLNQKAIDMMIDLAMSELDVSRSMILQMADPEFQGSLTSYDHSRLVGWIGLV
jgi:hypothetical protein